MIGLTTPARPVPDGSAFFEAFIALADLADPVIAAEIIRAAQAAGVKRRAALDEEIAALNLRASELSKAEAALAARQGAEDSRVEAMEANVTRNAVAAAAKQERLAAKEAEVDVKLNLQKSQALAFKETKARVEALEASVARREGKVANTEKAAAAKMAEAEELRADAIGKLAQINSIMSAPLVGG